MNQNEMIDEYIKNGGTREKLAQKLQEIGSCAYCGNFPVVFIDTYMTRKDIQLFGLCQKCFNQYHEDNVRFKKKVIRKLKQLTKKKQQDKKWDIDPFN